LVSLFPPGDQVDCRADTAEAIVEKRDADLVAFVRHFLANPDLPTRIRLGLPLNPYDQQTFCIFDFHGYTDDPFYVDPAAVPVHNSQKGESQCRTS
jgi:2,4-dienoyl-CoA reductase-like NADH-dependent reductase (Old Yellow Enzyme family)